MAETTVPKRAAERIKTLIGWFQGIVDADSLHGIKESGIWDALWNHYSVLDSTYDILLAIKHVYDANSNNLVTYKMYPKWICSPKCKREWEGYNNDELRIEAVEQSYSEAMEANFALYSGTFEFYKWVTKQVCNSNTKYFEAIVLWTGDVRVDGHYGKHVRLIKIFAESAVLVGGLGREFVGHPAQIWMDCNGQSMCVCYRRFCRYISRIFAQ